MESTIKPPYYIKLSMILFMLMLIGTLLYIGQNIIVPFAFSVLFGILLLPIVRFFEKRKLPRPLAIVLSLIIAFLFLGGIIYFLSTQIASFVQDIDEIKKQLNQHWNTVQRWVQQNFSVSRQEQVSLIDQTVQNMKNSGTGFLSSTFSSLSNWLLLLTLLPIYTFLILYYRDLIKNVIVDQFPSHKAKVAETLRESRAVALNYMVGLLIEMIIVATINSLGFLLIGIKYAIFLGVFAAILNLIPYIGMLVASVFCALITLTNSPNISSVIWVVVVLTVVQFFDNNIIMPRVVGSKVKINALVTILGVLIGGALCGIAGMFLSIPGIAILKIMFERIDGMEPWGRLLGDGTADKTIKRK